MAGGVVECAAARYQPQRGKIRIVVNYFGREFVLEVFADAGNPENARFSVGERHVDGVPRAERAQPVKDSGTVITVDVSFDDGRADLAGRGRVLQPRRLVRAGGQRRHLDGASFGTKFEGLAVSRAIPVQVQGLFHAGSVGIIMSGWLGAMNYGVIVANDVDAQLMKAKTSQPSATHSPLTN